MTEGSIIFFAAIALAIIIVISRASVVVPNQHTYVIERLGKYSRTLGAGFHLLVPFFDRIAYRHILKEQAIDVHPQMCITKDNIAVEIDGVLYLRVVDPVKASYGITNYAFAITQLAQTTMRSEIGKIDLDKTFESRENVNAAIVRAIDEASEPWGIKVTRYEIKNITPPQTIRDAMEKQMRAEREKREKIALSEGEMQAKINRAEGDKQEFIKRSEGEKIRLENEARGKAAQILEVARATAQGIREIAQAINEPGGKDSMQMRIAQDWIAAFATLARTNNAMIIPANLSDLATITSIIKSSIDFGSSARDS